MTQSNSTTDSTGEDSRDVVDGTPVEDHELHIGRDGLWIPPEIREFEKQVVFRTPKATLQHFGSTPLDGYYGMIDESHFAAPDELRNPRNAQLAPNYVSIKEQGEDARIFRVDTDPDVRV